MVITKCYDGGRRGLFIGCGKGTTSWCLYLRKTNDEWSSREADSAGSVGGLILRQHRTRRDFDAILREFICLAPVPTFGGLSQSPPRHKAGGLHSRLLHKLDSVAHLGGLHLESVAISYPTALRTRGLTIPGWHNNPSIANRDLDLWIRAKPMVTSVAVQGSLGGSYSGYDSVFPVPERTVENVACNRRMWVSWALYFLVLVRQ